MEREEMPFDVVIVGAGPAGLATAIYLANNSELSVCVVEKSAEIGGHILSGAVVDLAPLKTLLTAEEYDAAPLGVAVTSDDYLWLNASGTTKVPHALVPKASKNDGYHTLSLGNLCRYLAEVAESKGVEVFPGFAAASLFIENEQVCGVLTGDMGINKNGEAKADHTPGLIIRAQHTVLAEGARGHLGKEAMATFKLGQGTQHFAIGFKELWQLDPNQHSPGKVLHTLGWPLTEHGASGGGFAYHQENGQLAIGLIVDLNYDNPTLDPYMEFQRFKTHPMFKSLLAGGERIAYGARAINKSGWHGLTKMDFPGGMLIGCDAGTLDPLKIKGTHAAITSGICAAEAIIANSGDCHARFVASPAGQALEKAKNTGAALHKFGTLLGSGYVFFEQTLLSGKGPVLSDDQADYQVLKAMNEVTPIKYDKPDGITAFDRPSSVYLSNTNHEEDQPVHLQLIDDTLTETLTLKAYDEPAQRYCPAGVYEVVDGKLKINAQNCIHCKTCDIKEPSQNIRWVPPEGGGGPNYPNM
ncbi:electron transfer flavoprotein-ubiquinone oxidoreductase [Salinibius halmophilus]|uniref:electron transfer flavoprotein-ubiquinone oxidoreductase n=1 Tax=Salinibius halmophilus TaxID=1853216 RepID=UPI000E66509E|nr:electron transfer flavoprotein-ubiquinone oxidoreductase [Salinibius halmophilus]